MGSYYYLPFKLRKQTQKINLVAHIDPTGKWKRQSLSHGLCVSKHYDLRKKETQYGF